MFDSQEYNEAVLDLLAATVHETEARKALTIACDTEADAFSSALTQQKRLAVYAATEQREDAAERYYSQYLRAGREVVATR
jgi:hypothetical protein